MISDILNEREVRISKIKDLNTTFKNNTIVMVKANIPGTNKNIKESSLLINTFQSIIEDTYQVVVSYLIFSPDGNYFINVINDNDYTLIKRKMIYIEEHHKLGRFIDIDVFYNNEKSISRYDLGHNSRKCYICDNDAVVCARSKTHPLDELLVYIKDEVYKYRLFSDIANLAFEALIYEVFTYPKFGLVSAQSNGCHTDMDVYTFLISSIRLRKYFYKFAQISFSLKNSSEIFNELREIGKIAEEDMFFVTDNVNTHKGAIFLMGLVIGALSNVLYNKKNFTDIQDMIKEISKGIIEKDLENISNKKNLTNGERIYLEHNILGIRGEVKNGIQIVFDSLSFFENIDETLMNDCLLYTLVYLMSRVNDTTIIHKNSINTLNKVKEDMLSILGSVDNRNTNIKDRIYKLTDEYVSNNISPGGSADLLSVCYFLYKIKRKF